MASKTYPLPGGGSATLSTGPVTVESRSRYVRALERRVEVLRGDRYELVQAYRDGRWAQVGTLIAQIEEREGRRVERE